MAARPPPPVSVPTEEQLHALVLTAGEAGDRDAVVARRGALDELRGSRPVEARPIPVSPRDRAVRDYEDADRLYLVAVARGATTAATSAMAARRAALAQLEDLDRLAEQTITRAERVSRLCAGIGHLTDAELDQVAEAVAIRRRAGIRLVAS